MKKRKITAMLMSVILIFSTSTSVYSETLVTDDEMQNEVITQTEILPSEETQGQVKIVSEVEELRGEYEKHFLLENGEYMAVTYTSPVNYQNENGNWQTIDNTLETKEVNGIEIIKNKDGILDVTFAKNGNSEDLVTVEKGDYSISWNITAVKSVDIILPIEPQPDVEVAEEETPVETESEQTEEISPPIAAQTELTEQNDPENETAEVETMAIPQRLETAINETTEAEILTFEQSEYEPTDKATASLIYNNAFEDDIDVKYTVGSAAVKEDIILTSPKDVTEYNMYLTLSGLTATLNSDNSISFLNSLGKEIFIMPAAYMYDESGAESSDIEITLTSLGENEYLLNLIPDAKWLNSKERVYPVTIDPTVSYTSANANITDKIICNNQQITEQYENYDKVGVGYYSGYYFYTMLKMQEPVKLPEGAAVQTATLRMFSTSSASAINIGAYAYLHYWDDLPNWQTASDANTVRISQTTGVPYNYGGTNIYSYEFNITTIVLAAKGPQGFSLANGLLLKRESDSGYMQLCSSRNSAGAVRPVIAVTYNLTGTAMYEGTYDFTSNSAPVSSIVRDCILEKSGDYWTICNERYFGYYVCVKNATEIELIELSTDEDDEETDDDALWSITVRNGYFLLHPKSYPSKALTVKSGITDIDGVTDFTLMATDEDNERQHFDLELQESSYTFGAALPSTYDSQNMNWRLLSEWGYRTTGGTSKFHYGIDINTNVYSNTEFANGIDIDVYAIADGIVTESGWLNEGRGYCVTIKHFGMPNGEGGCYYTRYQHLKYDPCCNEGQLVKQGQKIGVYGNTGKDADEPQYGYHLHFEIMNGDSRNNNSTNPAIKYHTGDRRRNENNCNPAYLIGSYIESADDYNFTFEANPNYVFSFDDDYKTDNKQYFKGYYPITVATDYGYTGTDGNNSTGYWRY